MPEKKKKTGFFWLNESQLDQLQLEVEHLLALLKNRETRDGDWLISMSARMLMVHAFTHAVSLGLSDFFRE